MTQPFPKRSFPTPTREAWRARVEHDLKGAPYSKRLVARLLEGIDLDPLYTEALPCEPNVRPANESWSVEVEAQGDPQRVRSQLHTDLRCGADAARLVGFSRLEDLLAATEGVDLEGKRLVLAGGGDPGALATLALDFARARSDWTRGGVALDPWAAAARGDLGLPLTEGISGLNGACQRLQSELGDRLSERLEVSSEPFHAAGADEASDLAFLLAGAVEGLRAVEQPGAERWLTFRVPLTVDLFLAVAKLRALRVLWARVQEVAGFEAEPARVTGVSAWRELSARDPWVNMLRGTSVCLAGAVGGACALTIAPFDAALGVPGELGRRVARNTHTVLREESHLHRVADPGAGSYYLEHLTGELARVAWETFRLIEGQGGLSAALASGWVHERLAATRAVRAAQVAKRKRAVTGVSDFPHLDEVLPTSAPLPRRPTRAGGDVAPLPALRLSQPFEALRSRSEEHPRQAFLAGLGPLAEHTGRSTWIKNLLAAGGIESVGGESDGPSDPAILAGTLSEAFTRSGATLAVLCGSDARYASEAVPAAQALRAAGATVLLAGRPGEHEDAWRAAGVEDFAFLGRDVIELLERLVPGQIVPGEVSA